MVRDMVKLLRILARHDPILWEAIAPHVPKVGWVASSQDPIPPKLHPERVLQLEVRETVRAVAEAALGAAASGQLDAAQRMVQDVDDDWCGTGWPRRWPRPGPRAEQFLTESPEVGWQVVQAAAALAFGAYAAAVEEKEVAAMFGAAADQLAKTALAGPAR
ncbi:hypothetical protein AFE02nite_22590 [Actinotalea fermentans]|uniref:Uncharacterized protein n=2 Tax=Actinotalea fermentans TaxID=43671 RepID=A0A511YZ92_9CELL|nr:hypothetical protein AFE02nite_22590 [Actinotalea fermentans]